MSMSLPKKIIWSFSPSIQKSVETDEGFKRSGVLATALRLPQIFLDHLLIPRSCSEYDGPQGLGPWLSGNSDAIGKLATAFHQAHRLEFHMTQNPVQTQYGEVGVVVRLYKPRKKGKASWHYQMVLEVREGDICGVISVSVN